MAKAKRGYFGSTEPQARRVLEEMKRRHAKGREGITPPAAKKDEQVVRPRKDPNR